MIKKAKFLAEEAKLRINYMTNSGCLFCKIVSRETKADIVAESEKSLAFLDVNPVYKTHILIVPKRHIDSVLTLKNSDAEDVIDMYNIAGELIAKNQLDAFRLVVNGGKFQHVGHLHVHLMAGDKVI